MPLLGSFCLLFALALSAYCFVVGIVGTVRKDFVGYRMAETARRAGMATFVALTLAAFALVWSALNNDFTVSYILHHSNRTLETPYKIAVLWSGQEGSLLFWSWLLACYGFVLRLRHKVDQRLVATTSMILAGIQVFFLMLSNFVAKPFGIEPGPMASDGAGLNILLQYPEMVIHPPMLYLGYVGFSVPFAFALAALIMRYPGEKWIHITRRWTMVTWLFLSVGIALGAHWAYAVLGWGGYWGWDPVENASLLPWITGTAFLHSVMMQEKRGMMKMWNMWLIFVTFMLSILGTMLTRGGAVSSVHAFAQSSIGAWFYWFLGIVFVVCLVFFIRNRDHLSSEHRLDSLVSRESSFMFNNLVLLAATFAVLCGTLFPILSEAVRGYKITVGAPFFNKVVIPIGLFLIFLTAVGPLLAWGSTSWGSIKRNFAIPFIFSVAVGGGLVAMGMRPFSDIAHFYSWLTFALSALVIGTIATEFVRGGMVLQGKLSTNLVAAMYHLTRRNMRRYGGYVVHFGMIVFFIGVAGQAFNQEQEQEMGMGDTMRVGHYSLKLISDNHDDTPQYESLAAILQVEKNGRPYATMYPERRGYKAQGGQANTIVANHISLAEDLYVIYEGQNPQNGHPILKAFVNPLVVWVWIGVLIVILGTGIALVPNAVKAPVAVPAVAGALEKQGMQPAGVGK
jgi:cytochrome c-type biogenesis protein CcmF